MNIYHSLYNLTTTRMMKVPSHICNQLQFKNDDDYYDYDDDDVDDKVTQSYLQATLADGPPKIVQRICPPRTSGQT